MKVAIAPGLVRTLDELPVVEGWAEAARDRLGVFGALIVAEVVVRESQGLREHPAFALVLCEEGLDAVRPVAASSLNLRFEVVGRDERQDRLAKFWVFDSIDAPKTLGVAGCGIAIVFIAFV